MLIQNTPFPTTRRRFACYPNGHVTLYKRETLKICYVYLTPCVSPASMWIALSPYTSKVSIRSKKCCQERTTVWFCAEQQILGVERFAQKCKKRLRGSSTNYINWTLRERQKEREPWDQSMHKGRIITKFDLVLIRIVDCCRDDYGNYTNHLLTFNIKKFWAYQFC